MMNQQNGNGNGQKKAKSDFVVACNGIKMALRGRLVRPHILSTFDYKNKGFPKHSTYLIVDPNDPKVQQLAASLRAIKQQFYPNMPDLLWKTPIKDGRTPVRPDGEQWQDWQKGNVFIAVSTSAQYPPTALIKDPNAPKGYREATLLDEKNYFYDGADAVVEFSAGGMEGDSKGINLYFNGILGLGTGERIVISSSGSFNAEEAFAEFLGGTAGGHSMNTNMQGNQNYTGHMNNGMTNHNNMGNGQQNNMGNGQQNYQNHMNSNGNFSGQQNNLGGQQMNGGFNGGQQGQNQNQYHSNYNGNNNNGGYNGGSLV